MTGNDDQKDSYGFAPPQYSDLLEGSGFSEDSDSEETMAYAEAVVQSSANETQVSADSDEASVVSSVSAAADSKSSISKSPGGSRSFKEFIPDSGPVTFVLLAFGLVLLVLWVLIAMYNAVTSDEEQDSNVQSKVEQPTETSVVIMVDSIQGFIDAAELHHLASGTYETFDPADNRVLVGASTNSFVISFDSGTDCIFSAILEGEQTDIRSDPTYEACMPSLVGQAAASLQEAEVSVSVLSYDEVKARLVRSAANVERYSQMNYVDSAPSVSGFVPVVDGVVVSKTYEGGAVILLRSYADDGTCFEIEAVAGSSGLVPSDPAVCL